jgi:hypothetical protein
MFCRLETSESKILDRFSNGICRIVGPDLLATVHSDEDVLLVKALRNASKGV